MHELTYACTLAYAINLCVYLYVCTYVVGLCTYVFTYTCMYLCMYLYMCIYVQPNSDHYMCSCMHNNLKIAFYIPMSIQGYGFLYLVTALTSASEIQDSLKNWQQYIFQM